MSPFSIVWQRLLKKDFARKPPLRLPAVLTTDGILLVFYSCFMANEIVVLCFCMFPNGFADEEDAEQMNEDVN